MTHPTAEQIRTVEGTAAFIDRAAPTVQSYSGAIASIDVQRSRALGAADRLRKRLGGAQPRPEDLRTVSDAAGLFLARHRRDAWNQYLRHPWRQYLDARFPLLNATLWRLCQES